MIFDVGVRTNKQSASWYRVHDSGLSAFVRKAQDEGKYVFSVIPLFKVPHVKKEYAERKFEYVNDRIDIGVF